VVDATLPLAGRTVVTTRATPGRLDTMLAEMGAVALHAPLIEIEPVVFDATVPDGAQWLVVTSQHGAQVAGPIAAAHPHLRLAAVGTRTAEVLAALAGRPADLVPARQTAADLVEAFPAPSDDRDAAVFVLHGDLAAPTLVDGLRAAGHRVVARVAYRTLPVVPDPGIRTTLLGADAVTFASGSAARAWFAAIGVATPPHVVAIGPTTAAAAGEVGIAVTAVAATFDLDGLAAAVVAELAPAP